MQDEQGLLSKAAQFATRIGNSAKNNENIAIVAHHDADGLCAASELTRFIQRQHGHCEIRCLSEPSLKNLERIADGKFDLVLFCDLGSGIAPEIRKHLGDRWLVIDHHYIPQEEIQSDLSEQILNPWQFGYDGSKEVSSSGLVYFLNEKMRDRISSFFAIAGAISDYQDVGQKRSLIGFNEKIAKDAIASADISSKVDLLFYGRDTRPVHDAVSNTLSCFIPGLTGNRDACLASLRGAGIQLKFNSRWKTIADFQEEEKQEILQAIVPHLSGTTSTVEDLVGTVYSLASEDEYSPSHDVRDFVSLLNACGRTGKSGIALSICLGARGTVPTEAEQTLGEYRNELVRDVQNLMASAERMQDRKSYSLIVADGIVSERMTGAVCQVLASLNRSKNKIVFLRTTTQDGDVKISARQGKDSDSDLGALLQGLAKAASGVGGGHAGRAGARFSILQQQEFQVALERFQKS
ncbi:MAG: DHH family phosphoesterase [Nitrososphaerales archaeon]